MTDHALPVPVQSMIDAINAADTDALVASFAPDGYVDDWGGVLRGAEGVRSWAGSDAIGAGAQMTVLSAETEGVTTYVRFDCAATSSTASPTASS